MKTWNVVVTGTVSSVFEMEAETLEEAMETADGHPNFPDLWLCHQCANHMDLGDLDVEEIYNADDYDEFWRAK